MRQFYEEWYPIINRQPTAGDLKTQAVAGDIKIDESLLLKATDKSEILGFEWSNFFAISFSHHMEIISKAKTLEARLFYIYESAIRFWNKYTLRDYLNTDLYSRRGMLPNNFTSSMPDAKQALKAVNTFKDEYLLDFINIEELAEPDEDLHERVLEKAIVNNVKKFMMTLGQDFIFVGNQYRVMVAGEELFVEFAIRDYDKPMGVAVYRTNKDIPEKFRNALPNIDELRKLL